MPSKDARLYLRVSTPLKRRVDDYVKRHDTSTSALVTTFFENLLRHEEQEQREQAKKRFFDG